MTFYVQTTLVVPVSHMLATTFYKTKAFKKIPRGCYRCILCCRIKLFWACVHYKSYFRSFRAKEP